MKKTFEISCLLYFITLHCALCWAQSETTVESPAKTTDKQTVGWIEEVKILPESFKLHAKLSVSSDKTSIHAEDIEEFKKNKKRWVKFKLTDRNGKEQIMERPVLRKTKIKQPGGQIQDRFVVHIGICLGKRFVEDEVSLTNRSEFDQEVSIGRTTLAGAVIIDPARTFTIKPECKREQLAQ